MTYPVIKISAVADRRKRMKAECIMPLTIECDSVVDYLSSMHDIMIVIGSTRKLFVLKYRLVRALFTVYMNELSMFCGTGRRHWEAPTTK